MWTTSDGRISPSSNCNCNCKLDNWTTGQMFDECSKTCSELTKLLNWGRWEIHINWDNLAGLILQKFWHGLICLFFFTDYVYHTSKRISLFYRLIWLGYTFFGVDLLFPFWRKQPIKPLQPTILKHMRCFFDTLINISLKQLGLNFYLWNTGFETGLVTPPTP